jgi:two-component system sensor kinase FixL
MEATVATGSGDDRAVTIKTRAGEGEEVEVIVSDHGCGVPEERIDKLFTPFSTTKKAGMGMGLSISQAIVRAHGGKISFCNNEDGGATFYFTLPAADRENQNGR